MKKILLHNYIKELKNSLAKKYPDERLQEQTAWWMIEAITKKNRIQFLINSELKINDSEQAMIDHWIEQQVKYHVPLQYLLGSVPFCSTEIIVEPPTLIPRQETEEWCNWLIEKLSPLKSSSLRVLDLCSGSGCIGIALAKGLPQSQVYSIDISKKAISLGKKNASHNKISNITFIESDLFTNLGPNSTFDLIIANPPYISDEYWNSLDPSVTRWEDPQALISNNAGLEIITRIISETKKYLHYNKKFIALGIPQLILEIDSMQSKTVKNLLMQQKFTTITSKLDLFGNDRIVMGNIEYVATIKDKK